MPSTRARPGKRGASRGAPMLRLRIGFVLIAIVLSFFGARLVQLQGMDPRSYALATYALTGFANIGSIGIQLGGIGALAENRRGALARLGVRALAGGFLATLINASVAGVLM